MKTHGMFFHHRNLMGRFDQFETLNWSHHPFGKNEGTEPDSMRTKTDDENFNPDVQSQAIIKIFNDNNVKLTPDQEKAIKPAIGDFLKASRNFRHNRKDKEVKESK